MINLLNRQLCTAVALATSLVTPHAASAQAPWTVTITPTLNPLPIGLCGAVQIQLVDASGNARPRNPAGYMMGLADFDMSVAAADPAAVAGQQIDASHWSVCACQAGTAGAVATITASYPAQRLLPQARARGVSFQTTETVTLAAAKGGVNPPGCAAATPVALAGGLSASPGKSIPAPPAVNGAPAQTTAPVRGGASPPPVTAAQPGTPAPQQQPVGAPPTGVSVSGTPLVAHLAWNAVANAQRYAVWRGYTGTVSVERTPTAFTGTQFQDTTPDPRITYNYTVVAYYADGTSGAAPAVAFTSPPITNPTGFTATNVGNGKVDLLWQPVQGAVKYRIDGPGVPNNGSLHQTGTSRTVQLLPMGPLSWKVWTLFPGNFADYMTPTVASAMVRALPAHPQPWLTKNNGAGNASLAAAHYAQLCGVDQQAWQGSPTDPRVGGCFNAVNYAVNYAVNGNQGDVIWGDVEAANIIGEEAVYGNVGDLGFGRRTNCTRVMKGQPVPGLLTMCYATSHGPGPGGPGFADPATITRAAAGEAPGAPYVDPLQYLAKLTLPKNPWGGMPRSGTVIIKDGAGAFSFFAFTPGKWNMLPGRAGFLDWIFWDQIPATLTSLSLDSEGAKALPHSCLSCHGGQYNPVTKRVTGASFLPLDPGVLAFGVTQPGDRTTYERSGQEERIRRINEIVKNASPGTAVAQYINGLYNGAVGTTGAVARTDYVPQGWAAQSGFYLSVVKPYCADCHLAAPSAINFASWTNFLQNKVAIYNAVCVTRTMPHAEIPFREFWTKDTGPLYLPGLLAATLGYASCP